MAANNIPDIDKKIIDIINPDFENGPWICGGACMSWIQGEEVPSYRDVDVYFKNKTQWDLFINQMRNVYTDTNSIWSYTFVSETKNSLTFWLRSASHQWTVQAIKLYFSNSIEEVFDKFDITACKIATDGKSYKTGSPETVNHIFNKIIDIPDLKLNSVTRVIKYLTKGYSLTEDTYDKLTKSTITVWDFKYDLSLEYSEK